MRFRPQTEQRTREIACGFQNGDELPTLNGNSESPVSERFEAVGPSIGESPDDRQPAGAPSRAAQRWLAREPLRRSIERRFEGRLYWARRWAGCHLGCCEAGPVRSRRSRRSGNGALVSAFTIRLDMVPRLTGRVAHLEVEPVCRAGIEVERTSYREVQFDRRPRIASLAIYLSSGFMRLSGLPSEGPVAQRPPLTRRDAKRALNRTKSSGKKSPNPLIGTNRPRSLEAAKLSSQNDLTPFDAPIAGRSLFSEGSSAPWRSGRAGCRVVADSHSSEFCSAGSVRT